MERSRSLAGDLRAFAGTDKLPDQISQHGKDRYYNTIKGGDNVSGKIGKLLLISGAGFLALFFYKRHKNGTE